MTSLMDSFNTEGTTLNGAKTNLSSMDANVDLFGSVGASRGKNITNLMSAAYNAGDKDLATRIMLWARDVRGGAGERQLFRDFLVYLDKVDPHQVSRFMHLIPEVGRWDDLLVLTNQRNKDLAFEMIRLALKDKNALAAKWMPRKGPIAKQLIKHISKVTKRYVTPKQFRKALVGLSDTVEQKMSAKDFDSIDFSKLPSVASARYQKAFLRNAEGRYRAYLDALTSKDPEVARTVKINAGAVYPYDIVKSMVRGSSQASNAQWDALPDYLGGSDERILPMVDVSGSMGCKAGGYDSKSEVSCLDVAVSLGLYISERLQGTFKDTMLTFSESPELIKLNGSLYDRMIQCKRARWGMNTDIGKAFKTVLDNAKRAGVPQSEMPTKILILSDMEFDRCTQGGGRGWNVGATATAWNQTALQSAKSQYEQAGYKMPDVIFWNINSRQGNSPVTINDKGAAMVSGFSPAIMRSILSCKSVTPVDMMLEAVNKERYTFE